MAIHSSILAWKIPWTEEPGGLQSLGSQESDATERQNRHHHVCIYLQHNEHLLEFKLQEIVKNREAWHVAGLGVTKSQTQLSYFTSLQFWEMVMDREAWSAVVHGVAKSQTQLSD